ncbi:DUF1611 domain-containing protein [candidate division KSB1 bacterium]
MEKFDSIKGDAVVITNGLLGDLHAKTAHGLIRGTSRFNILGIIDRNYAGRDAGEVLDGIHRNIPVYGSIAGFIEKYGRKPEYAVVGGAFEGGILPDDWRKEVLNAIESGLNIVCGLHQLLSEDDEFREAARKNGVNLYDIRKPGTFKELHFWSGEILSVKTPIIALLGIDCAVGKRTTAKMLVDTCKKNGIKAEMIYTGQTGWMQGYKYGFIFDATLNDFVSGELEKAIMKCDREASPDLMIIEGQSGLRNPSGPCGSEFLLSANAKGVILQHVPFQEYYDGLEELGCKLPYVENEIALIKMYGAETLAVTLNSGKIPEKEIIKYQKDLSDKLNKPVIRPIEEGVTSLIPVIREFIKEIRGR